MKTKIITTRDFAAIKKMAQIVNPLVSKKNNILKKVDALLEEVRGPEGLDVQIAGMEAGIKARFFGLGTEQLVKKVTVPYMHEDGTPALDAKTGKQLMKTSYEPMPCLTYNEESNNYTLTVAEPEDENGYCDSMTLKAAEEAKEALAAAEADENMFDFPVDTECSQESSEEGNMNEDNPFGM